MTARAKAAGVSASSFLDLKAELARREDEFTRSRAAGKERAIVGGVKRLDKKPTVWARTNKGVKDRAARDVVELEAVSRPTLDAARAALERKAKIYDKLRKGFSAGIDDKRYDELLVDFDQKAMQDGYESDSDDVDESLTVPQVPDEDDPVIEYEDEFGRIRSARKSEVPRHLLAKEDEHVEPEEDDPYVIYGPTNHFPVYEPTAERVAQIEKEQAENPLAAHYDAAREVRAKGAAFYQFSGDEETRRKQMEELRGAREETGKVRKQMGAVDVQVGEVEGMREGEGEGEGGGEGASTRVEGSTKSRALEKRKRELEERRRKVDEKRRKVKGNDDVQETPGASGSGSKLSSSANASSSAESRSRTITLPADPFAALEAQSGTVSNGGLSGSSGINHNAADDFLAALESEIVAGKVR